MEYTLDPQGVDVGAPLIYMWEIYSSTGQVTGRYIGKANGGDKRPTKHYRRNVQKLLEGRPYKKGKDYRRVHIALADAVKAGALISLRYLCNVEEHQNIFEIERHYIQAYGCHEHGGIGLNGPRPGIHREARPVARTSAPAFAPLPEEASWPDLEDFLEYVEDNYPARFDIRPGVRRYSLRVDGTRLLRAYQSGPRGKVRIKLVAAVPGQASTEFAWDGSDSQLEDAIEKQLRLFGKN